jgi:O-antigen/teichoic acid export membrane protein
VTGWRFTRRATGTESEQTSPPPEPVQELDILDPGWADEHRHAALKERALGGVFIVAGRGVVILLVAFGGTVVLARLLTPADFGIVAIGTAVVMVVALLSDGGLGAALIRRPEPPTMRELQALTGLQLSVTLVLAVAFALVAVPLGTVAEIVALMAASMPIVALSFPGRILLERDLSYRPLAVFEIAQIVTYYSTAICLVLAGYGVWGLASATVAMRVVGLLFMWKISPVGLVRPKFAYREMRALLGFGVQFQAVNATWLVRDLCLSTFTAAIAGAATLGLWTLAKRLLEPPVLIFESLLRVSFPTVSHLVAAKADTSRLIERGVSLAIVANGLILSGLAASAPGLVPGLFGQHWQAASYAVPGACLGLAISGSVIVATQSYLYAVGDAAVPLRANGVQAVVWVVVAMALLPALGVAAIGLGWAISAVFEVFVVQHGLRKWTSVSLTPLLIGPVMLGIVAGGLGWLLAEFAGTNLLSGILGGLLASSLFLVGMLAFRRSLVVEIVHLGRRATRSALAGS